MAKMMQNNFSGGEISPCLYGRSDLGAYYKGCASAENFIVAKEGTLRKRHGISSVGELPGGVSFDFVKVVPYRYDRTEGGFLVLYYASSALSAVFYGKDGTAKTGAAKVWTGTLTPGQVKSIQHKQIGDQVWLTNGVFYKVVTVTDNATISVGGWTQMGRPSTPSLSCTGYTKDGNPYDGSGETTYYYCAYIVRDGVMSKMVKNHAYQAKSWVAGAFTKCTVSITAEQRDSMDYVVIGKSLAGNTSFGELTRFYKEDFVDAGNLSLTFTDKNISPGDGVYTQTNVLGDGFDLPLCLDCFQQRRVFANATTDGAKYPMTLWFSEVGNLDNFYANRPTADSDAFSPTIAATGPAFIRWIIAYQEMLVLFTDCGIFSVGFASTQGFSASSCRITRVSELATSTSVQPVVTDCGIVFVGADDKTVYTAAYDLQENMLKPVNRSVLVEHLTRKSAIRALALQSEPDNVVWVVTADGRYATFTFERNEEVYAWSHGKIEGCDILDVVSLGTCTDSSTDRTYGDLVFVVRKGEAVYLARSNDGYADVVGGEAANVVATLETLRPESQERTIVGQKKNVKDVLLRLYETGGLAVKPTSGGAPVPLVGAKTGTDALFTGEVKVMPRGHVNEDGRMTFVSDDARSCEILQVVTTMEVD